MTLIIIGTILLILQFLSVYGSIISGIEMGGSIPGYEFLYFFYFLPSIIGVVLIILGVKKKHK